MMKTLSAIDKENFANNFNSMICNETYKSTPFRSGLARRTYSSIRCSRQTQRTQLGNTENGTFNEQHQQYLRQRFSTISENCDLLGQNNEQYDAGGADFCIFVRGPTQLRDSRRKTAEQWQTRKYSSINDENCMEEIRRNQKVKFSPAINNGSFIRNFNNTVENKGNPSIKHLTCSRTHFLPSFLSSSIIGLKSKNRNSESNFDFLCHSDPSNPINSHIKSKELHLKCAGLREIHVNTANLNQIPLNEKVS